MTIHGGNTNEWYAVHVKPNCERTVAAAMEGKGYEAFLPLCWEYRNWAQRVRKVERTVIPGYVFGRFDPGKRLPIMTIPGVTYIVGTRSGPLPVNAEELAAIQRIVQTSVPAEPWPFLVVGEFVTLTFGPLRGLTGRLLETKGRWRIVISVTLLQRSVAVEVDRSWVRAANSAERESNLAAAV